MKMRLDVVVLAAGRGKRMHSDIAKVLHPIGGQAMLEHVLHSVLELGSLESDRWGLAAVHLVKGFAADQVEAAVHRAGLERAFSEVMRSCKRNRRFARRVIVWCFLAMCP
ncbi:MAG: hypothetical protein EBS52_10110 [Betaproteobacteria bacterium]|nr:hypothetical protein [Betaproteobacteria bacterium]